MTGRVASSDRRREAAKTALDAGSEIVQALAWTISGLDFSLPYGFEGKGALAFAGKLQELKADVIRQRTLAIVDALHTAAAVVVEELGSVGQVSRLTGLVDAGLRVVSLEQREATAAGVIRCYHPTMRFAMEAIDRFVDLMRTRLDQVGSELSLLDDVDHEQVRGCRDRYEDAARDLERVLLALKRVLASQIESAQRLDRSLASIWTSDGD